MRILLLCSIVILAGCTPVKKSDYTSVTYYEKHDRWLFPDKYTELVVAIPVDDRVPPAFCVTRHLFAVCCTWTATWRWDMKNDT